MAIKQRPKRYRLKPYLKPCSAPGCPKMHTRLAMCAKHESRNARYGSPIGSALKDNDLARYRVFTTAMLHKWEADAAIVAAHERMQDILDNYGRDEARASVGRKCRPFIDTIISQGATPRSCLVELSAVAFRWQMESLSVTAAEMEMQLATRLLLSKAAGSRGNSRVMWTRPVIGGLGYKLRETFCLLFFQMHKVWKDDEDKRTAQIKVMRTFGSTAKS